MRAHKRHQSNPTPVETVISAMHASLTGLLALADELASSGASEARCLAFITDGLREQIAALNYYANPT